MVSIKSQLNHRWTIFQAVNLMPLTQSLLIFHFICSADLFALDNIFIDITMLCQFFLFYHFIRKNIFSPFGIVTPCTRGTGITKKFPNVERFKGKVFIFICWFIYLFMVDEKLGVF